MNITIKVEVDRLDTYNDSYLAALWSAAQWNNAPGDDAEACRLVEKVGREIIRRWLKVTPPELWQRQGTHEKDLPAIAENAKVNSLIVAARNVVEQDHGANGASYRTTAIQSVEDLAEALRRLDQK